MSLNILKSRRRVSRIAVLLLLAGALTCMPMGMPGTSNIVEAGCFTLASSQCQLISSITVCKNGDTLYRVSVTLTNGVILNGNCGSGGLTPLNVFPCGFASSLNQKIFDVSTCDTETTVTVGYRIQGYLNNDPNNSKKWHGNIAIDPFAFSFIGQCITYPC